MKVESEKFAKICDEEADRMRIQLDTETGDVLKHHEQHMTQVIGRLITAQARKQAVPSAQRDPVIDKIEVCSCYLNSYHVLEPSTSRGYAVDI